MIGVLLAYGSPSTVKAVTGTLYKILGQTRGFYDYDGLAGHIYAHPWIVNHLYELKENNG